MTHVNEYLSFISNLQLIGGGIAIALFLVYLWWIGENLK